MQQWTNPPVHAAPTLQYVHPCGVVWVYSSSVPFGSPRSISSNLERSPGDPHTYIRLAGVVYRWRRSPAGRRLYSQTNINNRGGRTSQHACMHSERKIHIARGAHAQRDHGGTPDAHGRTRGGRQLACAHIQILSYTLRWYNKVENKRSHKFILRGNLSSPKVWARCRSINVGCSIENMNTGCWSANGLLGCFIPLRGEMGKFALDLFIDKI